MAMASVRSKPATVTGPGLAGTTLATVLAGELGPMLGVVMAGWCLGCRSASRSVRRLGPWPCNQKKVKTLRGTQQTASDKPGPEIESITRRVCGGIHMQRM